MPKPQPLKLKVSEIDTFHAFGRNVGRYLAKRAEYQKTFPDAYVAVLNRKMVAHAQDPRTLFERLRKEGRDPKSLFLDRLSDKAKLILRLA